MICLLSKLPRVAVDLVLCGSIWCLYALTICLKQLYHTWTFISDFPLSELQMYMTRTCGIQRSSAWGIVLRILSALVFETGSSLAWDWIIELGWLANEQAPVMHPSLPFWYWDCNKHVLSPLWAFSCGCQGLNSGTHACATSAFQLSYSLRPLNFLII